MAWLYMTNCGGFGGPKAYLDNQFTYQKDTKTSIVLASSLVGMRVYYAACEQTETATGSKEVFAIVCLVNFNPRAADGYTFGYKDQTEHMGPCEAECPEGILDLLTPTDHEHAIEWRSRCRAYHAKRQARPKPTDGDLLIFSRDMTFADGFVGRRFRVEKHRRTLRLRAEANGRLYNPGKLDRLDWSIVPRAKHD